MNTKAIRQLADVTLDKYPDTRGHLKAASKPCTHAFPSYVRFLAFSHLWHNITMPKLVKSILHSHL